MTNLDTLPLLPDDVEVHRASGLYVCEVCNKQLHNHPKFAYPSRMNCVVLGCDGVYYHL